jgi:CheY-like chemotaxis protein
LRILLAEDNVEMQRAAVEVISQLGCEVDCVADGAEAVRRIQGSRYDAVLMDCQMPRMDGFEAASLIRAEEGPDRRIPVVGLVIDGGERRRNRCMNAGMDDILIKPLGAAGLRASLDRLLRG